MNRWLVLMCVLVSLMVPAAALAADPATVGEHGERSVIPSPREALIPAVTTLLVFAFLLAVLAKYAWGPIVSGLKKREEKIRNDIREAEQARLRAEATLKEYNAQLAAAEQRVREMIAKAGEQGEQVAANIKSQAQTDAEAIRDRANREIEATKKQAIAEIYEQAATLGTAIAEKILRRNLNAGDQQDLVRQSLDQLETLKS
jgi:F-type H+-transporting ATPase subunit b